LRHSRVLLNLMDRFGSENGGSLPAAIVEVAGPIEGLQASGGACWYALHVRHRQERVVAAALHGKGYLEFLPTYHSRRRWRDRIAEIELPLFPGYVFCHFDAGDRRVPIVTTPGVLRIVGLARAPVPVLDSEIEAVRHVIASGIAAEPWPYIDAGQSVRIQHGPLAGLEGVFIEVKNRRRLVVSITLLQRSINVDIDSAFVVLERNRRGPRPAPTTCK
jgi:transcription antitermination factor NusG